MSMENNAGIEIRQLANGYVVWPAGNDHGAFQPDNARYVFQSMAGLIEFIEEHFTHREEFIKGDLP